MEETLRVSILECPLPSSCLGYDKSTLLYRGIRILPILPILSNLPHVDGLRVDPYTHRQHSRLYPQGRIKANTDATPIRRQYLEIKRQHRDAIVFFRLGDFYETFDEDAQIAARELDVVLTSRNVAKGQRVPMAGVPYHAAEGYIARLIARGYKVAVCEQQPRLLGRLLGCLLAPRPQKPAKGGGKRPEPKPAPDRTAQPPAQSQPQPPVQPSDQSSDQPLPAT